MPVAEHRWLSAPRGVVLLVGPHLRSRDVARGKWSIAGKHGTGTVHVLGIRLVDIVSLKDLTFVTGNNDLPTINRDAIQPLNMGIST